jgi:phosphatidylserine/phosphatidylglycerophosphate/cardiolipin synthase-like enzyme
MQNAVAFSNNDVITIAWSFDRKPDGCMGFALYRVDDKGTETVLPSHAVFAGETIKPGQTTAQFPIQKFYWKDVYARLEAEKTGNRKFRYKIVPLEGIPGGLKPMKDLSLLISNEVEIGPDISEGVRAFFNRGLISTQRVAKALPAKNMKGSLLEQIADPRNALRASLSGDMVEALTGFLDRAKTKGHIYAGLYELKDKELLGKLTDIGKRLHIVLSNSKETVADTADNGEAGDDSGNEPSKKKKTVDGNQEARDALADSADEEWNRIMPDGHIGHNKFLVYADPESEPKALLFGSTNWTSTGLCAQTNNTLVIDDEKLAKRYLDYWKKLKADTKQAGSNPKPLQGSDLRTWDSDSADFTLTDGTRAQSWFSPNTPKARSSKHADEKRPVDMEAVVECINAAEDAILFLAFYPGSPSIANWAGQAAKKNKKLFVRGCVTNKSASEAFYYELKGMTPPKKQKGDKTPVKQDFRVFGAEAFDSKHVPEGWITEILNAGFAIIHDKIMVIDPFSVNSVVITGSHNLGHKASYDNDENLAIIKGNNKLAMAYATHVLDVYDHFAARYLAHRETGEPLDLHLRSKPDDWLNKYFNAQGEVINPQLNFWMSAAVDPSV